MDITGLSSAQLRELKNKVADQLRKTERAEKEQAIEQCFSIAHSVGLPLATLMAYGSPQKASN